MIVLKMLDLVTFMLKKAGDPDGKEETLTRVTHLVALMIAYSKLKG